MSLSNRPTRPFGHSDLPTLPPAPAASPRLRRAAGKEGRLATDHPATPTRGCAARVAGPECTDVLEDRKRRPDRHGQRPGPRGRRRALLAEARRGRCGTLPGFCSLSSAVVAAVKCWHYDEGLMYFQRFFHHRLGPLSTQPNARLRTGQNTRTCMWSSCGLASVGW